MKKLLIATFLRLSFTAFIIEGGCGASKHSNVANPKSASIALKPSKSIGRLYPRRPKNSATKAAIFEHALPPSTRSAILEYALSPKSDDGHTEDWPIIIDRLSPRTTGAGHRSPKNSDTKAAAFEHPLSPSTRSAILEYALSPKSDDEHTEDRPILNIDPLGGYTASTKLVPLDPEARARSKS